VGKLEQTASTSRVAATARPENTDFSALTTWVTRGAIQPGANDLSMIFERSSRKSGASYWRLRGGNSAMTKLVFQAIAMLAITFCDIHLAMSGRPFEAVVITVATIIVAL
jgi:hypothetical protein